MRILVVDDHELVRRGICAILATEPRIKLCGEASDGREAVEKATLLQPDLIIMDISMPEMNGIDASRQIRRSLPETQIIIVSQHATPERKRDALDDLARAFISKSELGRELLPAIAAIGYKESEGITTETDTVRITEEITPTVTTLTQSDEHFRSVMSTMAEGLYTVDLQGLVTYINSAAESMFGWNSHEILGRKMHAITHHSHLDGRVFPAEECAGLQVLRSGLALREHEDFFIRKDGSFFPVIFSASPLKTQGNPAGLVVCFRDDTNRRRTEAALRESEQIYRGIGESIEYGIWICDAHGQNIYASPSFLELVGLTQQQCSELKWMNILHPDDVELTNQAWRECVRTGARWEREHRFRGRDGQWHYVLAVGMPIRNQDGSIRCWAGINLSIQRLKETEIQLQHLVQTLETRVSERTQALEKAGGELRELSGKLLKVQDEERRRIARELHDGVGQLLAAIGMNLSRIAGSNEELDTGKRLLKESTELVEQASREIRTLSHLLHPPLLDEIGLESALKWFVTGFAERSNISVNLDIVEGFSKNLPSEIALTLFRILQECLTNVHRHSNSRRVKVIVQCTPGEVHLAVEDWGTGIPSETFAKISTGASSGMGLRGMRERIRQFGGQFDIRSDISGTCVSAVLPLSGTSVTPTRPPDVKYPGSLTNVTANGRQRNSSNISTILCIDDEATGLSTRTELLESAGYRVIGARSGAEGITLFRSEKIDAVILDYWMAEMKGTIVAAELKRLDPQVPIIVLSGVSDLPGESSGLIDQWIVKGTIRAEELLDSVSAVLERRSS